MELPVKATAVRTAVDRQRTSGGGGRAEAGSKPHSARSRPNPPSDPAAQHRLPRLQTDR